MSRKQTMLEEELEIAVYTDRLILLLESEEGFNQVILSEKQFDLIRKVFISKRKRKEDEVRFTSKNTEPVIFKLNLDKTLAKDAFEFMTDYE